MSKVLTRGLLLSAFLVLPLAMRGDEKENRDSPPKHGSDGKEQPEISKHRDLAGMIDCPQWQLLDNEDGTWFWECVRHKNSEPCPDGCEYDSIIYRSFVDGVMPASCCDNPGDCVDSNSFQLLIPRRDADHRRPGGHRRQEVSKKNPRLRNPIPPDGNNLPSVFTNTAGHTTGTITYVQFTHPATGNRTRYAALCDLQKRRFRVTGNPANAPSPNVFKLGVEVSNPGGMLPMTGRADPILNDRLFEDNAWVRITHDRVPYLVKTTGP